MPETRSLNLNRFLSDFTLGFSDGLTVPFALTAGLSSLGKSDTVIYAGLAELCAGSISMGIGGYLAALDEIPASTATNTTDGEDIEEQGMLMQERRDSSSDRSGNDEKPTAGEEDVIVRHLAPLALADSTVTYIVNSMREQPGGLRRAARQIQANYESSESGEEVPVSPVGSGLSISAGYVVGGIIPLFPYFFASTVGIGLVWSIVLCLIALMSFGTGKSLVLGGSDKNMRKALWSGVQMLILGSLAAMASVLAVNLLDAGEGPSKP